MTLVESPSVLCAAGTGSGAALMTFLLYTAVVFLLAGISNRLLRKKSFLSEYFLGSRNLGVWAFAMTFAATSSSGGSFMGFPAKIYTHGWVLSLWIASYMVMPICAIGLLAKRINRVARITGAITVPDVLRDRFRSVPLGLLTTLLIVYFMAVYLVGQFKAGSVILQTLLRDVEAFQTAATGLGVVTGRLAMLDGVDPQYLLCLISFGVAVIVYTTYGGFRAVVWTDVMQGVVMVTGVAIMLPLALYQVGGLERATREMAQMTPPRIGTLAVSHAATDDGDLILPVGRWLAMPMDDESANAAPARLFRVSAEVVMEREGERNAPLPAGPAARVTGVARVVEITTPLEIVNQIDRLRRQQVDQLKAELATKPTNGRSGGESIQQIENRLALVESDQYLNDLSWLNEPWEPFAPDTKGYSYGDGRPGTYVTCPGPNNDERSDEQREADGFLPLSLAIAFFFMWAISATGQPPNMVRLMAFNHTRTLARSIFTVSIYYTAIYFPLVVIFCCARVLLPGREGAPDEIMPEMAVFLTGQIGHGWLAGLLVAAPFAAVMSTVDSFLLLVSSALVRDVYQRNINPAASETRLKRLSYAVTLTVGIGALLGAVSPPRFLQDIIVYAGSGLGACFLAPMVYGLFWRRANAAGAIAGMLAGFLSHLSMYLVGFPVHGSVFSPYRLWGLDPIILGLAFSFVVGFAATICTPRPPESMVRKFFCRAD